MRRCMCILTPLLLVSTHVLVCSQENTSKEASDGVYAVLRESTRKKEVLPLKQGEALVVHRHRYLKTDDKVPDRFLVVRSVPDVSLDLAEAPKAIKENEEVTGIFLKLRPKAAKALEQLTRDRLGETVAIVIGGEVVTAHKVREVIRRGEVQITSCAKGAANYLLKQLQARQKTNR